MARHPASPPAAAAAGGASSSFAGLGVHEQLVSKLRTQGISQPTDVQQAAIPLIRQGHNVAIQSQTGSGKVTGVVFSLPARPRCCLLNPRCLSCCRRWRTCCPS
jgi:hypothetical protein